MEIGEIIRDYRLKKELTQEELGKIFYVSRQLISKWENGRSYPDLNQLIKLSDYFDLSLDELMRGDKEMIKKKDFQANMGKKGKWLVVFIGIILLSTVVYFTVLTIKINALYKNLKTDAWQEEEFNYTQIDDSIQYNVFKIETYNIFAIPDKLQITATALYTMDDRAFIGGSTIYYDGNKENFSITWSERALVGQQLRMDYTFEYKKELQEIDSQTLSYEFEKVFDEELEIERPYLKSFLNEVEKKWEEINK